MPSIDAKYFRQRAASERAMAQKSANQKVRAVHEEAARLYEALADEEARPRPVRLFA